MTTETQKMPVLFIGHGSPMNAIEDNKYTRAWESMTKLIPKPTAILAISAHWYTMGTKIMDEARPKMIYDMQGFPRELYEIVYDTVGSPDLAHLTHDLISQETTFDNTWGYDHGTWSVLVKMYPQKDIPVFQLSIDGSAPPEVHYEIGRQLRPLREKGVLILGSGNVVHNLRRINWSMENGYDWANEFDHFIKDSVLEKNFENVVSYKKTGNLANLAVPTPDHFYPLLYVLGASDKTHQISVYNDACLMGSMSMTSYLFSENI